MRVRRLNEEGLRQMNAFLDSLVTDSPQPWPGHILTDALTSEPVLPGFEVESLRFERRLDVAKYLFERIQPTGMREPERDKGLWAWLALVWFESLCPVGRGGKRKPGARPRWIPSIDEARRYYRHLLLGPFLIYRRHAESPDRAMVVLTQSISTPGDVVEQIASRQDLVNCDAVMGAATWLYCDVTTQIKRGAGGKSPGSARRLAEVLMQFDLTFDLQSISISNLVGLLPKEFQRWAAG